MRYYFTLLLFLFFCMASGHTQTTDNSRKNALSFELGKTGLIYNLGFDHRFPGKNFGFRFTIGSNFGKHLHAFSAGGGGYYLAGKKKHFECGIDLHYLSVDEVSDDQKGFVLIYPDYSIKTIHASIDLGYRKYGNKSLFRIGVAPGFIKNDFLPGAYISYGFIF